MTEHDEGVGLPRDDGPGATPTPDDGGVEQGELIPEAAPSPPESAREPEAAAPSPEPREPFGQERIAPRVYYSIGEVCDLTGLRPHVLRYWETQFEVMNPTKNRAGNRVYRPKDIDLIVLVKRLLYEKKFTIEGARKRLLELRSEGELEEQKQEVLGPEFLSEMKRELLGLKEIMTLPAQGE